MWTQSQDSGKLQGMKETLNIETERIDDIPLLISHMQRMQIAELLDKHIPTHGHRKGLSVGELSIVWLAYILSQADHRMNRVQEWAMRRLDTLRGCGMKALQAQDLTDDRLADLLRLLSDDVHWQACEQELMGQLLRVYDLPAQAVRIDTTTASSYAEVTEEGLLQLGHSKDHRPDLPQLKVVLASLDPLGMPLATEVISGEHADDPVYVPIIARVREGLQQSGLLYVGGCKMAATHAAQNRLQERLHQAQQALQDLTARRQGKARLVERTQVEEAITDLLTRFRVEELLCVRIEEHVQEHPVRAYRGRVSQVRREVTFTISCERQEQAIAQAMSQLGWRGDATTHLSDPPSPEPAVQ